MKQKLFKTVVFGLTLFLGLSESVAQEDFNAELKYIDSLAQKMFIDINNKDFEAILDMTHPKVFEMYPKEEMKTFIKSMFEGNEEFSIEMPKIIPKYTLSKLFKSEENNLNYVFVSYDMPMKMTFNQQEFDDEGKKMMISMMSLQGMDVDFISNNALNVLMKDSVTIILKEDATFNKWVMVNYNPDSPLFYQIVSSEVMDEAKGYKQNLMLERKKNSEN